MLITIVVDFVFRLLLSFIFYQFILESLIELVN